MMTSRGNIIVKLTKENNMKQIGTEVQYFNMCICITLPFVAADKDGVVKQYSESPDLFPRSWESVPEGEQVCKVDLEGIEHGDTLREFAL